MRWSAVAPETKWCSQLNSVINRLKIFQFVDLTSTAVVALLSFSIPGTEYKYTIVYIRSNNILVLLQYGQRHEHV